MPGKTKENTEKTSVLKGLEAEEAVLKYLKKVHQMNRPFGTADVFANLKGAVPKTATQKILSGLADKGEITQKPFGKTILFVAKQSDLEDVPAEKLAALEAEHKAIEEENKLIAEDVKKVTSELTKLKATPTDQELQQQLQETKAAIEKTLEHLIPLRAGTSALFTAEEIAQLDADWVKWRAEWVKRRKVFNNLWLIVSDSLPPQLATELAEELGIEFDTAEHGEIEHGPLCAPPPPKRR